MTNGMTVFNLRIRQCAQVCDFELSWGQGQILFAQLNYPDSLTGLYQEWQNAYLSYYRQLRGRAKKSGSVPEPTKDWRAILVKAEGQLLYEFHDWLRARELYQIRAKIASAISQSEPKQFWVDVFLTCTPLDLARLPWETWEIGTDLGASGKIRIARTPANIYHESVRPIRRKARILAILGDDTGLNLAGDETAMRSLSRLADVTCIGWKAGTDKEQLKTEIVRAIADERGWDILFFAGHSNETIYNGGELSIAPKTSLLISDIQESLKQAKERGLQFAIFNSCSGINIAESLINLGLSQVAVMREPIHNKVAQDFLLQFLKSLADYKDVHESLLDACQFLKRQEKYLNYPSAHLVPSLFRHPKSELFRIEPFGFWHRLKRWQPTKREAAWLLGFALISLLPPVQDFLLEPRVFLQAVYRQVTFQMPRDNDPPVVLVQIDAKSLRAAGITGEWRPIDYNYLARLVNRVSNLGTKVLGIDYILDDDEQPENSQILGQSVRQAVDQGNWLVFAQIKHDNPDKDGVSQDIANLNWSMEGNISFFQWYVELLPADQDCSKSCPFAYLLALSYSLLNQESPPEDLPHPNLTLLNSKQPFRDQVINTKNKLDQRSEFLQQLRLSPLTDFSENLLQLWWQPIIDFSIPPDQAYQSISACEVLGSCPVQSYIPANLQKKVVLIAPGGYQEAGVDNPGEDNFSMPLAVSFWRKEAGKQITGGEVHAYMIHQLLARRLVVPIPDLWMILVAAVLGKGIRLTLLDNPSQRQKLLKWLGGATAVYGLIGLQVYISAAVLIPLVLPSAVFWNYVRLALARKS
jgi:hypothetical protein